MKSNLSIFVNGKNIGSPVIGQGANTLRLVVQALCAAQVKDFNVVLFEDTNALLNTTRQDGGKVDEKFCFISGE